MTTFKTISELHKLRNLPRPLHPLISIIHVEDVKGLNEDEPGSLCFDFYSIALKRVANASLKYGQNQFNFDEGIMSFLAPGQVFSLKQQNEEKEIEQSGWVLLIHPDFLWNTSLSKSIKRYDFWGYALHEALFLSNKEELLINGIIQNIEQECQANIDQFSKQIIVSQLETLLNYATRFYNRQFITNDKVSHKLLENLEALLDDYFNDEDLINKGLPTVQHIAQQLHISPKYLSSMLKSLTGQNTQQHIHEKLIAKAKEKLSSTDLSVSEIAYGLGFEHLQSFSKLFKAKTTLSPLGFRESFN